MPIKLTSATAVKIERKPLDSSFLLAGGYHPESKTLHLEFKSKDGHGKVLEYSNIPPEKATAVLDAADSHGKAYHEHIRPFYVGAPLGGFEQKDGDVKLAQLQAEQEKKGAAGAIQRVLTGMGKKP
jgi:hypothetical protein